MAAEDKKKCHIGRKWMLWFQQ